MFYQDKMQARRLKYFSRPPWRSYHFLVSTLLLLMVTFFPIEVLMDLRVVRLSPLQFTHSRMPPSISLFWMFSPIVVLVVLWARVWIAHSDVYQAVSSTSLERLTEDARIAVPLDTLAYILYGGLNLALFAVAIAYAATDDFVKASLHR